MQLVVGSRFVKIQVVLRLSLEAARKMQPSKNTTKVFLLLVATVMLWADSSLAQAQGGVYDFAYERQGERRGDWTPSDWMGVVLLGMTITAGLALSIGFCYYARRREARVTRSTQLVAYI